MKSFAVLFVFACIAGSFGKPVADDDRCQGPDQLHGRMVVVVDNGFVLEMNYQADNHQQAQRYVSHTHNMEFDSLLLYQTFEVPVRGHPWEAEKVSITGAVHFRECGKQYTVSGQTCYVSDIDHPYHPFGLPDSFNLLGEGELAGEMDIQAYGYKDNNTAVMIMMAEESCTPALIIAKAAGHTSVMTFLDTDTGVDADAFTIPAECANAVDLSANVRRSFQLKVAKKRGMGWEIPSSKRDQSWFKL